MNIYVDEQRNIFMLQTQNTTYAFGVDNMGLLRHIYWGKKIEDINNFDMPVLSEVSTNDPVAEITPEEFPVYGGLSYKQHCLKVEFIDKSRGLVYKYNGYSIEDNLLIINLRDNYYDFEINLHYKIYSKYDLLERYTIIKNNTKQNIKVDQIQSAQFHIPYIDLNFSNVHGYWGAEQQRFTQKVSYGKILIESRRGISTHNHNPYFILDRNATETSGDVYFGALRLSGNFRGVIEQTQYGETLVQMGINSHDFELNLEANSEFTTPSIICGYTNGFEQMSINLHKFAKDNILRKGNRPVLYNSWEAAEFKVNCDEQIKLAKVAHEIGAELFVVDDGWFGERNSIDNGLGDWYVNKKKFPDGLEPLIKEVKDRGMLFGLWFEPEMVNPLSDLYKEHPDWIYYFENRKSDTSRGQYVLNITKPEVKYFVLKMFDNMLSKYDIDYIKWDANRPISQSGHDKQLWYNHIQAVYDIVKALKVKYPNVLFEACASGGGRIDYGILGIFDDFWTSDNTDAFDRLTIQKSYSYIYPIKAMRAWVTDVPNFLSKREIPMKFRFHSAMMGTLGIGCNILKLSYEDLEMCKEMIALYKSIRHIIEEGDFYRLENTSQNDYEAFQYLYGDEGLLFVFLPQSKIGHTKAKLHLRNLEKNSTYILSFKEQTIKKTGDYLMNFGIDVKLTGDYDSTLIKFSKV